MNQVGGPVIRTDGVSVAERRRIHRAWKNNEYVRLSPGHFIPREDFDDLDGEGQAVARVVAYAGAAPTSVVVGRSAARIWGFPVVDSGEQIRREKVELASRTMRTRELKKVRYRRLGAPHDGAVEVLETDFGDIQVTDALTTALDLARWGTVQDAVWALDHGVQAELFSLADIRTRAAGMGRLKGAGKIHGAARLASAGSESPRETDVKLLLHGMGLPAPWQQADIHSRDGEWLGRVDFFWPELGLIIEYDGRGKYLLDPADPDATRAREHRQGERYRVNGLVPLYICDETLRNGTAQALIGEFVTLLQDKGLPYPEDCWSAETRAWEC